MGMPPNRTYLFFYIFLDAFGVIVEKVDGI